MSSRPGLCLTLLLLLWLPTRNSRILFLPLFPICHSLPVLLPVPMLMIPIRLSLPVLLPFPVLAIRLSFHRVICLLFSVFLTSNSSQAFRILTLTSKKQALLPPLPLAPPSPRRLSLPRLAATLTLWLVQHHHHQPTACMAVLKKKRKYHVPPPSRLCQTSILLLPHFIDSTLIASCETLSKMYACSQYCPNMALALNCQKAGILPLGQHCHHTGGCGCTFISRSRSLGRYKA